jgi:F-type H+-transporting ATPase subunit a
VFSLVVMNELVFLGGLVPDCPLLIVPFIFLVEVVSLLIRPVALVLRLIINMTCGHILLVVRGILGMNGSLPAIVLVLLLESGVALVQGFVFFMILSM